jgi:hypothetical protein
LPQRENTIRMWKTLTESEFAKVERAVGAYLKAVEAQNDRAAYAHALNIQKNAVNWVVPLVKENRAFRNIGTRGTTAVALENTGSQPMKAIYVCSAIRGDISKCMNATRRSCKILIHMGYIPIAPLTMFSGALNYENALDKTIGLTLGLEMIRFCSELWVFNKRATEEMQKEIERAMALKIPTRWMND